MIEVCYWLGGGKEGQFPLGFGQRGGTKGTAINTKQGAFQQTPTANIADTEEENIAQPFTFMTMGESSYKIDPSPPPEVTKSSNNYQSFSSDQITNKEQSLMEVRVGSSLNNPNGFYVKLQNKQNLLTLMDSGASDHCITDQTMFITYEALNKPLKGLSADKGSSFDIIGKGNAMLYTCVNGGKREVILKDVLYTPSLRSNLISVSTLLEKGAKVYFDGDEAVVKTQDGTEVMSAVKLEKLFAIKMDYPILETFIAQSN